ncbi:MAG: hypothetical protein A4E65_03259 [Syntrophorhabdus sp. PtaU1.Bin153]|nr:MAG: hypothetical protein A4E65_03259 [Syntrophorhabdus sp. PtaU1.Bin153]
MPSLIRPILVVVGLLPLLIPFNVSNAQIEIISSEGTKVIGEANLSGFSNKEPKTNWTRVYAPGEREREYRQAVEMGTREQQMAAERKASEKNQRKEKKLEVQKKR